MQTTTIGLFLSRIRKEIKAVKQDTFLTDRFLYSFVLKHAPWLLRREDSQNKLLSIDTAIQPLEYVELIEVDKVEAGCRGLRTGCRIMRTEYKLPELWEGYSGALIRSVTSVDTSEDIEITDPVTYLNMTKQTSFKYNKTKYCWFLKGYLYFPNLDWEAVRIEGYFRGDVSGYGCDECKKCKPVQERPLGIPSHIEAELESHIKADLAQLFQIPSDNHPDKQNLIR
jgi:hypothetical protein